MTDNLFEIFSAYYHQAVELSKQHEFKKSSESFDKAFEVLSEIRSECLKKYSGKKITRIKSSDEIEYERLKGIVLELRNSVGELSLEIEDIEAELGEFQVEYNSKVGRFYIELDKINYEIQILRMKMDHQNLAKDEIEQLIAEQLKELREQIEEDEEQFNQDEETIKEILNRNRTFDEKSKRELRDLYRDLAKIYHPDKARTDDEKKYFEVVMKEINDAYHHLNIETLRRIEAKAQLYIEIEQVGETLTEKIERLVTEKQKIEKLIINLNQVKADILNSDTYRLMIKISQNYTSKDAYYTGLIDDLKEKIRRRKIEYEKLKSEIMIFG